MKLITIITPTYNRADQLKRLYQALVNQSFQNFRWLIVDDGSNDHTSEVVTQINEENKIEIEYVYHENVQLFLTMYRGYKRVKTPYVMRVDSDDTIPSNSLEILWKKMEEVKHNPEVSSVIGRVNYSTDKSLGGCFPDNYIDYVFKMKNDLQLKGVHAGLFKTDFLKLEDLNEEKYLGRGYVSNFIHMKTDSMFKTYFINEIVYTYFLDEQDSSSLTNTKFNLKYAFGLKEYHLHYLRYYFPLYFKSHPKSFLKQMFKYIYYGSFVNDQSLCKLASDLKSFKLTLLFYLILPLVKLYKLKYPVFTKL